MKKKPTLKQQRAQRRNWFKALIVGWISMINTMLNSRVVYDEEKEKLRIAQTILTQIKSEWKPVR
jgi:hypothetical protein